jgi:hypothetical protein
MGRPPIAERAMTSSERQNRRLARIREQAAAAALASRPTPARATDVLGLRFDHIDRDLVGTAEWFCQRYSRARAFVEACSKVLANRREDGEGS